MEVTPASVDTRPDARGRPRSSDKPDGVFGALLDTGRETARPAKASTRDRSKAEDQPAGTTGENVMPFGTTENASASAKVADRLLAALAAPGGEGESGGQQTANALGLPAGPPPQSAPPPNAQPSGVPANAPATQPPPASSAIDTGAQAGPPLPEGEWTEPAAPPPAAPKFGNRIEVQTERLPEVSRPSQDLVRSGPAPRSDAGLSAVPAAPSAASSTGIAGAAAATTPPTDGDLRTDINRPADALQTFATGTDRADRAAIPDTASATRPHPATAAIREQVVVQIVRAAGDGLDRIGIQLNPPTLGRVDVRLELGGDGRVVATVTADHQSTLDLMQRDARGLERALNDAGLKADAGGLSFNLRDGGGSDGRSGQGTGSTPTADTDPAKDMTDQTHQPRQSRHDGAVDMSV